MSQKNQGFLGPHKIAILRGQKAEMIMTALWILSILALFLTFPKLITVFSILPEDLEIQANCGGAISCGCGDTLNESITLTDINCNGTALNIGADNLTIDCNGSSIIGNGSGYGINAINSSGSGYNIIIKNCTISNFSTDINANGAYNPSGAGFNGGIVTVESSKVVSISSDGGNAVMPQGPYYNGGSGGIINLINSNSTNLTSSGGNGYLGGDAGKVNLTNSNASLIIALGTSGMNDGKSGIVQVSGSAVNEIDVHTINTGAIGVVTVLNSSNITYIKTYGTGASNGGNITVANSFVTNINASSGNGDAGSSQNIYGGFVNVTNSSVGAISNYGGDTGGCSGLCYASNGGNISVWNSAVNSLNSRGGDASQGIYAGKGGNIIISNSSITFINSSGGFGKNASSGGGIINGTGGAGGNVTIINSKLNLANITIDIRGGLGAGGSGAINGTAGILILNNSEFYNPSGIIKFFNVSTNQTNFSSIMGISDNLITLDSDNYKDYNKSANVTLNGIYAFNSTTSILRNGIPCNQSTVPACYNFTALTGNVKFNVSSFTDYSIGILSDINLSANLISNGNALNIGADNLTIDCKGYSIIGNGTGYGINAMNTGDGRNVTIKNCNISNFSIDVNAKGASISYIGYKGGNVQIENSNAGNISTEGGTGSSAGDGGDINITNSNITTINAYGGNGDSPGNSGTVKITSNSIITNVNVNGIGSRNGGSVTVSDSKVTLINAYGSSFGPGGGNGGSINITNSNITTINVYGGESGSNSGSGGSINITNSNITTINAYGGGDSPWGGAAGGNGGNIAIINSRLNLTSIAINISGGIVSMGTNGTAGTLRLNNSGFYTKYGIINFLNNISTNQTAFTNIMNISNNSITLNSSTYKDYNKSANLTLNGVSIMNPTGILRNGAPCPASICYNFTLLVGNVKFNVSYFTNYSINGSICGNNIPESGEGCDPPNATCPSQPYGSLCVYCSASCHNINVSGGYCGDNITQTANETCDGNTKSCSSIMTGYTGTAYCNLDCKSYNTAGCTTGGGGPSGGGGTPREEVEVTPPLLGGQNYILEDIAGYNDFETVTLTAVGANDTIYFTTNYPEDELHKIVINNVDSASGTVAITFSSDPSELVLRIGITKEIDANNDGFDDITVMLEGFAGEDAIISFKKLAACGNAICEAIESSESCCRDCGCEKGECKNNVCEVSALLAPSASRWYIFVLLPIVIVVVIGGLILLARKLIKNAELRTVSKLRHAKKRKK